MDERERLELARHVTGLVQDETKDTREIEAQLRTLVEPRRVPHGRVLFVPAGTDKSDEANNYLGLSGAYDWKRKRKRKAYLAKKNDST